MAKSTGELGNHPLTKMLIAKLDYDQLTNCMRCGFCLPACPTFRENGLEQESLRGRIALMKAVTDGLMEPDGAFREQLDHCLGCRACEPACPADVKFGQLMSGALTRSSGAIKLFSEHMREMENILPDATVRGVLERLGEVYPAKGSRNDLVFSNPYA